MRAGKIFASLLMVLAAQTTQAQAPAPGSVLIQSNVGLPNAISTRSPGAPGFGAQLTFVVLDDKGLVRRTDVEAAELRLEGRVYQNEAAPQRVADQRSTMVVIDVSPTLPEPAFRLMRDKLASTLGALPDGGFYGLVTAADSVSEVLAPTQSKEALIKAVGAIKQSAIGGVCLHEATYTALNRLAGARGRSGVLLVTASGDTCNNRSASAVLTEARNVRAVVYALGMGGQAVRQDQLEALTKPTQGLTSMTAIGDEVVASALIDALHQQWIAGFTVFAQQGQRDALLVLRMKDGVSLSQPVTLLLDKAYEPPTLLTVSTAFATNAAVRINFQVENPARVGRLDARVFDAQTNEVIGTRSERTFGDFIDVPAALSGRDGRFRTEIVLLDGNAQVIARAERDVDLRAQPPVLRVMDVQLAESDPRVLTVTIDSRNLPGLREYQISLVGELGDAQRVSRRVEAGTARELPIDVRDVPAGKYTVQVRALDGTGKELAASEFASKASVVRRNGLERLLEGISQNPLAIAALALAVAVTGFGLLALVRLLSARSRQPVRQVDMKLPDVVRRAPPKTYTKPSGMSKPAKTEVAAMPLAQLEALAPHGFTATHVLRKPVCTLGRSNKNDVVIILPGSSGVSGQHAQMSFAEGAWFISDRGSTNGTRVNGLQLAAHTPHRLASSDVIGLGAAVKLRFVMGPSPNPSPFPGGDGRG